MSDTAARLALRARRYEVARFTFTVHGIDMTGVAMAMQVRLQRGTPGAPLIALGTVTTAAAEGLKLASVRVVDGVPVSVITCRINQSTMSDGAKVPYAGEIGADTVLAYAMQWTLGGEARTRIEGDLIVSDSAFGSDNAPANRPVEYGSQSVAGGDSGTLTFGDQVIAVTIDGAEVVASLAAQVEAAAERAEDAAATINTVVDPIRNTVSKKAAAPALGAALWKDALGRVAMILSRDGRRLRMTGGALHSPRNMAHTAWGVTDALGRVAMRLSRNGRRLQLLGGTLVSTVSSHSAWGVSDALGRVAIRLSRDGRRFQTLGWTLEVTADGTSILRNAEGIPVITCVPGKDPVVLGTTAAAPLLVAAGRDLVGSDITAFRPNPTKWAGWGSSTMDRLDEPLQASFANDGIAYYKGGVGGEWSYHTLARQGARPALIAVAGGSIPASGTVDVTVTNIPTSHPNHYAFAGGGIYKVPGSLGGVRGSLYVADASVQPRTYRFDRETAGAAMPVAAGTPFIPDAATTQRDVYTILNLGKNDMTMLGERQGVIDRTAQAFAYLSPLVKCCLVLNHYVDTNRSPGDPLYANVAAVNAAYAARYGSLVVDNYGWLRGVQMYGETVWTKTGLTPTNADVAAMNDGRKPPSLSSDDLHMSDACDASVVWLINQKIAELGWKKD